MVSSPKLVNPPFYTHKKKNEIKRSIDQKKIIDEYDDRQQKIN